jgi:hypothetical protein
MRIKMGQNPSRQDMSGHADEGSRNDELALLRPYAQQ